jgi:S1-C subfamily serine protease
LTRAWVLGLLVAFIGIGEAGGEQKRAEPRPQPWFGMSVRPHRAQVAEPFLLVERTTPGGPADRAGILAGDLVTAIGSASLRFADDLDVLLFLAAQKPGTKLTFHVVRNGRKRTVELTIGVLPESARAGWQLALQRAREARIAAQRRR